MLLGQLSLATGDKRRVEVDYTGWLEKGEHISAVSTSLSAGSTATLSGTTTDLTQTKAIFFVTAGSIVNENFTVTVQITDTLGQINHDTLAFTVTSP